jgi:LCP family protein required for cell wall assembly
MKNNFDIASIFKKVTPRQIIFWAATLALAIGAFVITRFVIDQFPLSIGGTAPIIVDSGGQTPGAPPLGTPTTAAPPAELPPAWDGASRVTMLLLGVDYADWSVDRQGPSRSDTMMLLTVDPLTKTAGMLSIPRDMWVEIPGFGHAKINTAYYLGDANKLPGGGPALAVKTVEQFIGVPVQYYAQVDFSTFVRFINEIGCVKIDVPQAIKIDPIGDGPKPDLGKAITLQPDRYTLCGDLALAYARARYTEGGDVDRAHRQQQVIFGIRDRLLDPKVFPMLLGKAPLLYQELSQGVRTNLSFDDAMKLAILARQIPKENIKTGVIDFNMVTLDSVVQNGQTLSIFKPIPDKIRVLRDQIFTAGGALSPMAQGDPVALMQQEGARVIILNASSTNGLASKTADYLRSQGVNVVNVGNADQPYSRTVIIDQSGKPYVMRYLASLFKVDSPAQVVDRFTPNAPDADVILQIGQDWGVSNPMP